MLNRRGNYRRELFTGKGAAESFQACLLKTAARCGWRVHAFVVMSNHYHLAVETPGPNLSEGRLQGTWATRFNRFRGESGRAPAGPEGATVLAKAGGRAELWEETLQAGAKSLGLALGKLPAQRSAAEKVLLAALMKTATSVSNGWRAERLGGISSALCQESRHDPVFSRQAGPAPRLHHEDQRPVALGRGPPAVFASALAAKTDVVVEIETVEEGGDVRPFRRELRDHFLEPTMGLGAAGAPVLHPSRPLHNFQGPALRMGADPSQHIGIRLPGLHRGEKRLRADAGELEELLVERTIIFVFPVLADGEGPRLVEEPG